MSFRDVCRFAVNGFAASVLLVSAMASGAAEFIPLPLAGGANTGFTDTTEGDRQGGWIDLGGNDLHVIKPGRLTASRVPFEILDETAHPGKTCVVLGGPKRPYLPAQAEVPVAGVSGAYLYLMHAAAWCPPAKELKQTGVLRVDYADGGVSEYPVRCGQDVADWSSSASYTNAARGWTAYNNNTQVSLFVSRFALEKKPLKALRFEARESAWMVVAATVGEDVALASIRPNVMLTKTYEAPAPFETPLPKATDARPPKNIILIIGDGMGAGAQKLTSLYQHKAESRLVMQQLPVSGRCVTRAANAEVTDSAASGTAIATGYKTNNGMVGMDPDQRRLVSVMEQAHREGRAAGIITSDAICGATPSSFYAHVPRRGDASDISLMASACGYGILIGNHNSAPWFLAKDAGGLRVDNRNLVEEMGKAGYVLAENPEAFARAPAEKRVIGFMACGTLDDERCLAELLGTAVNRLSRNASGFMLMLECTITDAGGHSNNPEMTVRGTLQVDWAVKRAVEFALKNGETLVLVTADHETGGLECAPCAKVPGQVDIRYTTTNHTAALVPLYAFGPGSALFGKTMDNTGIAKNIAQLWRLSMPPPGAPEK